MYWSTCQVHLEAQDRQQYRLILLLFATSCLLPVLLFNFCQSKLSAQSLQKCPGKYGETYVSLKECMSVDERSSQMTGTRLREMLLVWTLSTSPLRAAMLRRSFLKDLVHSLDTKWTYSHSIDQLLEQRARHSTSLHLKMVFVSLNSSQRIDLCLIVYISKTMVTIKSFQFRLLYFLWSGWECVVSRSDRGKAIKLFSQSSCRLNASRHADLTVHLWYFNPWKYQLYLLQRLSVVIQLYCYTARIKFIYVLTYLLT